MPYHSTFRNREAAGTGQSQQDATKLLDDFERPAWWVCKRFLDVPLVQYITLDNDFMGIRNAYNQVKNDV